MDGTYTNYIKAEITELVEKQDPLQDHNTCVICLKRYQTKKLLKIHNQIRHLGAKINHCDSCDKSYDTADHLKRHKMSHSGEKPLECNQCNYRTLYKQALNHHTKRVHTKELPFHCGNCNKKYVSEHLLRKHLISHLEVKPYRSEKCPKSFCDQRGLSDHTPIHLDGNFLCDKFNKKLPSEKGLDRHLKIHTEEHKVKLQNSKKYFCTECEDTKGFRNKSGLTSHQRKHTGERPYICNVCQKCFGVSTGLWIHKRTHLELNEQRPYKCDQCEKRFTQSGHLSIHVKCSHLGMEGRIICPTCGQKNKTKQALTNHLRIHSGEKPYECNAVGCGFTSATSSGVTTHNKFVHLNIRTLKCHLCDSLFQTKSNLRIHIQRHTGEKTVSCSLCSYKCFKNGELSSHMKRIHEKQSNIHDQLETKLLINLKVGQ
jgi:KRAB domain-containing zinc finger protein